LSGIFFGINIAVKGMMAQQAALNVISHNIANANTPGYTRQEMVMETSIPISGGYPGAGQLGSGVEVAEVRRCKDQFIDFQIREETSTKGEMEVIQNNLQELEVVFMEPSETGFSGVINEFWNGWLQLSVSAESSPIRTTVKEAANQLCNSFRHIYTQLSQIKDNTEEQLDLNVLEVNSLANQIASLNRQIVNIKMTGDQPNDLMDQRDAALDQLAALGNISVSYLKDAQGTLTGAIKVQFGDKVIVDNQDTYSFDPSTDTVENGEIAGLQVIGGNGDSTQSVQYYLDKLDTLAVSMAKNINDIHITGKALDGSGERNFFVFYNDAGELIDLDTVDWNNPLDSGLSAGNIYINPDIEEDVSLIAAAKTEDDGSFMQGNGDIANQIQQLKDTTLDYDDASKLLKLSDTGEITFGDYYEDFIAELGSSTQEAERMVTNQEALLTQLTNRKESIAGVSLDEETANMVRFQHAFQANARVISVMDELLDTIINRM